MVNKKILLGLATLSISSLLGATNSFASLDGFYVGGQVGWGRVHLDGLSRSDMLELPNNILPGDFTVTSNHVDTDDDGWAGRVYIGWQFDCHWAAELGWSIFSNVDTDGTIRGVDLVNGGDYVGHLSGDVDVNAVDLVLKGTLPIQNNFSVYGKLGVAYLWTRDGHANGFFREDGFFDIRTRRNIDDEHKFFPTFGVGIAYDITPCIVVNVEYDRIQKVGSTDLDSTDLVTAGLAYHFGWM